ncbi:MAG: VCBS repeat-containing protein [Chthoniobacterales bacterium]
MKTKFFPALAGLVIIAGLITPAFGNHRTGSFALPELISSGDFDRDGNLDLAVSVTGFDNTAIFRGDGAGGLTLVGHLASDTLTKGLDVADINGDNRLDLVGATAWGYDVIVHLGDGIGGFGHRDQVYNGDGEPTRLILRDLNNDNKPDIAVNAPDEGKILIYLNNGKGAFFVPAIELENLPHCFGLASGDLNNDGKLDLVTSTIPSPGSPTGNVTALLGDGTGNFTPSSTVTISPLPTSVATGDLNNDGKLDYIVAGAQPENTAGNFFTSFLGDGTGKFTQKQNTPLGVGNLKGEISLGDFNEDGKLDLAFPVTGNQIRKVPSKVVLIYFGDGTGNMVAGPIIDVGSEPHTVITRDFNKDGHLDMAVTNRTDGTVSILLGDGHGNFTLSVTRSVISSNLDP